MVPALAGFWLAPRLLAMGWIDRLAAKVETRTGWASVGGLPALRAAFDGMLRRRSGLTPALAIHMGDLVRRRAGNLAGALSARRSALLRDGVAIESLGHAVKAAGFLIPGAWGVQEGGYIALCAAFGIGFAAPPSLCR